MSDMLNEKFEEFVTEQKVIVEAGDPMPTVSANVIPGTGSEGLLRFLTHRLQRETAVRILHQQYNLRLLLVNLQQQILVDQLLVPSTTTMKTVKKILALKPRHPSPKMEVLPRPQVSLEKILCQQLVLMQHTALPRWAAQLHIQSKQVLRSICQQTLPHF